MSVAPDYHSPERYVPYKNDMALSYALAEWLYPGDDGSEQPAVPRLNPASEERLRIICETDDPYGRLAAVRTALERLDGEDRQVAALIVCGFPEAILQTYGAEQIGSSIDGLKAAYAALASDESLPAAAAFIAQPDASATPAAAAEEGPRHDAVPEEEADFGFDDSPGDEADISKEEQEYLRSTDIVRWYMKEAGKRKLLTAAEEVELAKQIETGLFALERAEQLEQSGEYDPQLLRDLKYLGRMGERAKHILLESNLRLVIWTAKRYQGKGLEFIDLIQEGNLGLVRAVEKFDYARGYKFSTYATWWVKQSITRALQDKGHVIRLPVHKGEQVRALGRFRSEFYKEHGRWPENAELAAGLDMTEDAAVELTRVALIQPLSLDQTVGDDGESTLGDFIEDGDIADPVERAAHLEQNDAIDQVLAGLSPRERDVAKLRFGLDGGVPYTLDRIGDFMGVTRERIRQIEQKMLSKLRHPAYGAATPLVAQEADQEWRQDAACKDAGVDQFFHPEGERGPARQQRTQQALRYCGRCAVVQVCAARGVSNKETYGIRGNMNEKDFLRYKSTAS